ncbi:MAG TPA: hypothetical protein VNU25_02535 [Candidatus Paceibacterota bacterium]|nr:hypothetical protein [Candidatus Paceibacterota bacterium]
MSDSEVFVVLAQRGSVINLLSGKWSRKPEPGEVMKTEAHQEDWRIVKVFKPTQVEILCALATLMGGSDEKIRDLFDICNLPSNGL